MKIKDLKSAVSYLKSHISYEDIVKYHYGEEVFDLGRFETFLKVYCPAFGKLKVIHVTGSKGKGTTSNLICSYLNRAGYKAGIFNSPYVLSITESVGVGGANISSDSFVKYVNELKDFDHGEIPYFELLTAIAFKYFVDNKVDFAVMEVGLGGRLDSTNVCHPVMTVLTRVEREHTEILGRTYKRILNEKLGIVKDGVPLVVAPQKKIVLDEIKRRRLRVPVFFVESDSVDDNYSTALNVLLNLMDVDVGKFNDVYEKLKLIGRFDERKVKGVPVVFDMAHTLYSARRLVSKLGEGEFILLVSMMQFKNVKGFLNEFRKLKIKKIFFTTSHEARGMKASEIKKIFLGLKFDENIEIEVIDDADLAFEKSLFEAKKWDQHLVVTGSHFLISKILRKV